MHRSLAFSSLRLLGHHCRRVGQVAITKKHPPHKLLVGRALFMTETAFKMNSPTNKQDDKQIKSPSLDDDDDEFCEDVEISEEFNEKLDELIQVIREDNKLEEESQKEDVINLTQSTSGSSEQTGTTKTNRKLEGNKNSDHQTILVSKNGGIAHSTKK